MRLKVGSYWTDKKLDEKNYCVVRVLGKRKRSGNGTRLVTYEIVHAVGDAGPIGYINSVPILEFLKDGMKAAPAEVVLYANK